jgi:ribosome-binding protein aMBF1 (putative translation factor)
MSIKNMNFCEKCGISNEDAILQEVITKLGLGKMCEKCVNSENLPMIKSPEEPDPRDFIKSREPKPNQDLKNKLVDNFHWNIQSGRRRTKLSTKQLAEELGETEEAIKTLETGKLLNEADTKRVVDKLEQYLRVKIKKEDEFLGNDLRLVDENVLIDDKI